MEIRGERCCRSTITPIRRVRLKAAKATLAVAPETALKMLRTIAESREYPQAGEAGISLDNLKDGIFKPT
jgi:hypothetical protein